MQPPWLEPHQPFPPAAQAQGADSPWPGLLAAGGVLDAPTLRMAYTQGIFPWYSQGQPLLWWSTDPRLVLRPENFRLHKSLRKRIRAFAATPGCEIRIDTAFEQVIRACAVPRAGHDGTWITPAMVQAYHALHQQGLAHSVETWIDGQLAGGLYGVALGRAMFGESMFSYAADASKIALAVLVALCRTQAVEMIDCQQETPHLTSLGARPIARAEFIASIERTQTQPALRWQFEPALWQQILPPTAD